MTDDHLIAFYRNLLNGDADGDRDLLAAQNLVDLLMETTATPIFVKDESSRFLACNQAFADYAGLTSSEIVGRLDSDMPWASVDDAHYVDWDRLVIRTGRARWGIEEPLRLADGSTHWLETNKVPFRHTDGEIIGVIGSIRDVTDQREAEDALRQALETLDLRVAAQTVELIEANSELRAEIAERRSLEERERQHRRQVEVLRDIASAVSTSLDIETVLDRVTIGIRELIPADLIAILLLDDDGRFELSRLDVSDGYVVAPGPNGLDFSWLEPLLGPGVVNGGTAIGPPGAGLGPAGSAMASVMVVGGQPVGCVLVENRSPDPVPADVVKRLGGVAAQTAATISTIRLSLDAVSRAALEERERLARELHDSVIQTLWSVSLLSEAAMDSVDPENPLHATVERIHGTTTASQDALRSLVLGLQPDRLEYEPLAERLRHAVSEFSATTGTSVVTQIEAADSCDTDVATAFHRIAQETLNNVMRHADATEVTLSFSTSPSPVLCITDNGRGFITSASADGHLGLGIMSERAAAAGCELTVRSSPGNGTQIIASLGSAPTGSLLQDPAPGREAAGWRATKRQADARRAVIEPPGPVSVLPATIAIDSRHDPSRGGGSGRQFVFWALAACLSFGLMAGFGLGARHMAERADTEFELADRASVLADRFAIVRAQNDELAAILGSEIGAVSDAGREDVAAANDATLPEVRARLEETATGSGPAADEAQRLLTMLDEVYEDWTSDPRSPDVIYEIGQYLLFEGRIPPSEPPTEIDALRRLLELDAVAMYTLQEALIIGLASSPGPSVSPEVASFVSTWADAIAQAPGYLGPDSAEPLAGGLIDPEPADSFYASDVRAMNEVLLDTDLWDADQWIRSVDEQSATPTEPAPPGGLVALVSQGIDADAGTRGISDRRVARIIDTAQTSAEAAQQRASWLRLGAWFAALAGLAAAARAWWFASRWLGRLNDSARSDPLTGIGNRKLLETETARCIDDPNLGYHAIAVIDMDRFKIVNDAYGHAFGDRLLRLLAAGLSELGHGRLAERSTAVRMGGDEFLISLHSSVPIDTRVLAESLDALRRVQVSNATGELVPLSFSYGIAHSERPATLSTLIEAADLSAYQEKARRRGVTRAPRSTPAGSAGGTPERTPSS